MSAVPILAAEYTNGTQHSQPVLTINLIHNGRRSFVEAHEVSGKREARSLSATLGATPWNF